MSLDTQEYLDSVLGEDYQPPQVRRLGTCGGGARGQTCARDLTCLPPLLCLAAQTDSQIERAVAEMDGLAEEILSSARGKGAGAGAGSSSKAFSSPSGKVKELISKYGGGKGAAASADDDDEEGDEVEEEEQQQEAPAEEEGEQPQEEEGDDYEGDDGDDDDDEEGDEVEEEEEQQQEAPAEEEGEQQEEEGDDDEEEDKPERERELRDMLDDRAVLDALFNAGIMITDRKCTTFIDVMIYHKGVERKAGWLHSFAQVYKSDESDGSSLPDITESVLVLKLTDKAFPASFGGAYEWRCTLSSSTQYREPRSIVFYAGKSDGEDTGIRGRVKNERSLPSTTISKELKSFFLHIFRTCLRDPSLTATFAVRAFEGGEKGKDVEEALLDRYDYALNDAGNPPPRPNDAYTVLGIAPPTVCPPPVPDYPFLWEDLKAVLIELQVGDSLRDDIAKGLVNRLQKKQQDRRSPRKR
jgi:hypothetical protein